MASATITVGGTRTIYSATGAGGTTAISGTNAAQKQAAIYKLLDTLRDQQNKYWDTYNTGDTNTKDLALNAIKANVKTQSDLYRVAAEISELNATAAAVAADYENSRNLLSDVASEQLAEARANAEELISANDGKKRMIELNTYYGKRFNAQAGVVKLFIYTCVPVLILAILANAGLIPTTIAGFIIVIIIVTGLIYIYAAVSDINRRSKMNFDEYEWEFDPSRVGNMSKSNPNYVSKGGMGAGIGSGCVNGNCCGSNTIWDPNSGICNAQGTGGGTSVTGVASTAGGGTLIGDLASLF